MTIFERIDRLDNLIKRKNYEGISLDNLNAMYVHLDSEINLLAWKLERIEKAAMAEEDRLNLPANTDAWRRENKEA